MYRIQQRKYSSNIIEKNINDNWVPYIAPVCNKKHGDIICNNMINLLNNKVYCTLIDISYKSV